jgi:hypothetical protein
MLPTATARATLEQRRARSLGLTADNAPYQDMGGVEVVVPLIAWIAYRRVRGAKTGDPGWPLKLAQTIIQAHDRRRAWRRAGGPTLRGVRGGSKLFDRPEASAANRVH